MPYFIKQDYRERESKELKRNTELVNALREAQQEAAEQEQVSVHDHLQARYLFRPIA